MKHGTRLAEEDRKKMREMREQGHTWGVIGKMFDVTGNNARKAARWGRE